MKQRTADPYGDTDVIDARAPRTNQAFIGTLALVAFLVDWWPLLAVLAGQLALGLTLGRRWCVACVFYFEVLQPRLGEGPLEDSRPPRFANVVGVAVLGAASVAHAAGAEVLGWSLGLLVAGLALLSAVTGLCAGCELYRLGARLRGVRPGSLVRVDLAELDAAPNGAPLVVQFSHPLCTGCRALERRLRAEGAGLVTVDVSERPDLARKYGIAVVPTAVTVAADGAVVARIA
jgi:hypothetical protein